MPLGVCPECDEDIRIPGKPRLGQRVSCQHCGAQLELVELDPLELDWVYEDDDEDEDDDLFASAVDDEEDEEEDLDGFYEEDEPLEVLELDDDAGALGELEDNLEEGDAEDA
jgi:alpha-aminoadipate/glutamate carrier protein LysW